MTPDVVITGSLGTHKTIINANNVNGGTFTNSWPLDKDIGEIQQIAITPNSSDGWKIASLQIKSGFHRDWVEMGCTNIWIDVDIDPDPYDAPYYTDTVTLDAVDKQCKMPFPKLWGPKTDSGCFCKMTGKSGTCALNGDKNTWCRTKDKCKGISSSYGNYDYCKPA